MFNAKLRRRTKTSERRDWYVAVHRMYDARDGGRPLARAVKEGIEVALGNPGLAEMHGTIY